MGFSSSGESLMHHIRRMHKRFGLTTTGMFAIVAEFLFLLPCAVTALYCLGPYVSPREVAASPTATQLLCVCVFVSVQQEICGHQHLPRAAGRVSDH